jgi:hypothetical protein
MTVYSKYNGVFVKPKLGRPPFIQRFRPLQHEAYLRKEGQHRGLIMASNTDMFTLSMAMVPFLIETGVTSNPACSNLRIINDMCKRLGFR